ncbi:MAG: hypothetical protein M1839_000067 [Geoglossum umbratile]|nr:MAG: hypothetical protein M1839_000067 [Geoglossum umbratile]
MTSSPNPQDDPPVADTAGQPSSTEDPKSKLSELVAKATLQYSHRNYSAASDLYAQAAELQAEIHGEDSTKNADLLYHYGRSLYQVGVSKSDVLGGKVAGDGSAEGAGKAKEAGGRAANSSKVEEVASKVAVKVAEEKDGIGKAKADDAIPNKPFFQITGDENFDDSDDEGSEEGAAEGGAGAEEEDDLKAAWDILDLSRVLYTRQWDEFSGGGKGKGTEESDDIKHIKERLSDVHDLLAEISLESENFPSAVSDFRAALALKEKIYPADSSVLAEAHYKLSLALEFAATTTANGELQDGEEPKLDEAGREEAAKEMEAAIESCRLRVQREEAELAAGGAEGVEGGSVKKRKVTRKGIDDVKEMIAEMVQRLTDLRAPPVPFSATLADVGVPDGSGTLGSILGSILGESPDEQRARVEEATKNANDISGLVRRKKHAVETNVENGVNGNGKRKVEPTEPEGSGKRARVEDASD